MSLTKYLTLEGEMKKNKELKMSDIQILREWCEKQPHLPKIEDVQLAMFLHNNYYRIESAKNTIENYYTIRTHVPEFFSNRDLINMKELQQSFKAVSHLFLEGKTKEGYDIVMAQLLDYKPSHYNFSNVIKINLMMQDQFICTHGSTSGLIYIIDTTGASFGHVGRISPVTMSKLVCYVQEALPARLISVHLVNVTPVIETLFNISKPFIKKELMPSIYFHASMEKASEYFPIDVLPNENGGKAGPIQELMEVQRKKIENFHDWFIEDERINRVNESLRIGKSKTTGELFGIDGSFKNLDVD